MLLVGLTGGIGSGKSSVSARLAGLGAVVIDADAIVHELQSPGQAVLAEMVEEFGAQILHADGSLGSDFSCDEPITLRLTYEVRQPVLDCYLTLYLQNIEGTRVLFADLRDTVSDTNEVLQPGTHRFSVTIPSRLLAATTYLLSIGSAAKYAGVIDHHHDCAEFTLRDLSTQHQWRRGVLGIQLPWQHELAGAGLRSDA